MLAAICGHADTISLLHVRVNSILLREHGRGRLGQEAYQNLRLLLLEERASLRDLCEEAGVSDGKIPSILRHITLDLPHSSFDEGVEGDSAVGADSHRVRFADVARNTR